MSDIAQELEDVNACDDRCRGRCSKCPNDTIREAVAEIRVLRRDKALLVKVAGEAGGLLENIISNDVHDNWESTAEALREYTELCVLPQQAGRGKS